MSLKVLNCIPVLGKARWLRVSVEAQSRSPSGNCRLLANLKSLLGEFQFICSRNH